MSQTLYIPAYAAHVATAKRRFVREAHIYEVTA